MKSIYQLSVALVLIVLGVLTSSFRPAGELVTDNNCIAAAREVLAVGSKWQLLNGEDRLQFLENNHMHWEITRSTFSADWVFEDCHTIAISPSEEGQSSRCTSRWDYGKYTVTFSDNNTLVQFKQVDNPSIRYSYRRKQ